MMNTKRTPLTAALLLGLLVLATTATAPPAQGDYEWLKQRLEVTKSYTLEVMEAMPDEAYDFQPNDDVRTFKAQAYHIVYSIDYFNRVFKGNPNAAWSPGDENSKSKAELMEWAKQQFDTINETILGATQDDGLTAGIMSYMDHNAHHRGQMITYLRLSGITPPTYR